MNFIESNTFIIIIPFIISGIFLIFSNFKSFKRLDNKLIRRLYYLLGAIWIYIFVVHFYNYLIWININNNFNIDKRLFNLSFCILILLILLIFWEFLFISCKSLNTFSIKDVKLTTEELEEASKTMDCSIEDKKLWEHVNRVQYKLIRNMYNFYNSINDISGDNPYRKLIKKYKKERGSISIHCFLSTPNILAQIKRYYKISDVEFSSILYSLQLNGVCLTPVNEVKYRLFAIITTPSLPDGLLIIMSGDRILADEHLIIQNLVSYFDRILDIEGLRVILEELRELA